MDHKFRFNRIVRMILLAPCAYSNLREVMNALMCQYGCSFISLMLTMVIKIFESTSVIRSSANELLMNSLACSTIISFCRAKHQENSLLETTNETLTASTFPLIQYCV